MKKMTFVRKGLIVFMLCITLIVPYSTVIPATAEEQYIISWNFGRATEDDMASLNNAGLLYSSTEAPTDGYDGWFNVGLGTNDNSSGYSAPCGGLTITDSDTRCGVELRENKSGMAHALSSETQQVKSGIYEITFSALTNGSKFAADVMGSLDNIKNKYSDRQRNPVINVDENGTIYLPPAANPVFNIAPSWIAGVLDTNEWFDVTEIINLDKAMVKTIVRQNGKIVAQAVQGVSCGADIKTYGLGYLRFINNENTNGAPVVANVTVKDVTDTIAEAYSGFSDDFSYSKSSGYCKDYLFNASNTINALKNSGWSLGAASGHTIDASEVELVTDCDDSYIEFSPAEKEYISFPAVIKSSWEKSLKGIVHISTGVFIAKDSASDIVRILALGSGIPATLEFVPSSGRVRASDLADSPFGDNTAVDIGKYDPSEWCNIDMYVDTETSKWFVSVMQNDTVVAQGTNLLVRKKIADNGIDTVRFETYGTVLKVDYLTVTVEDKLGEMAPFTIVNKTEPNCWEDALSKTNNWSNVYGAGDYPKSTDYDVLDVSKQEGIYTSIGYTLPKVISDGTLTIDCDLTLTGNGFFTMDLLPSNDDKKQGTSAPQINNSGMYLGHHGEASEADITGIGQALSKSFERGKKQHIAVTVMPSRGVYDIKIYSSDEQSKLILNEKGQTLYAKVSTGSSTAPSFKYVKAYDIRNISFRSAAENAIVENFVINHIPARPQLRDDFVNIKDMNGNAAKGNGNVVSAAIESITLDFGTPMPEPDGTEGIELFGDSAPVGFTLQSDDNNKNVWAIVPDRILNGGETYTLFVLQSITDLEGRTLEEDFTTQFTTKESDYAKEIIGVIKNDENYITSLNDLSNGDVVTIDTAAVNGSYNDEDAVWLMAYYDKDDVCVKIDTVSGTIYSQNWLRKEDMPQFTIDMPSETTKIVVMFWNNLKDICAYCDSLKLELEWQGE